MALTFVLPPSLGRAKATARAELIESTLARDFGEQVIAVVAESYAELERQALSGEAELVWAPAVVCAKLSSARAVFTIVREGRASYRSALVGRKDQGLALTSLHGKRAAWVDPLSAGGYLLIASLLRARGLDPDRTFASQTFFGSHRAAIEAVLHETADVAAVSAHGQDEESLATTLRWYAGPKGDLLSTIAVSESCPNDALVITSKVGEADATRLLSKLGPAAPGRRALSRVLAALEADRLEPADLEDYRRLRTLLWHDAVHEPGVTSRPPESRGKSSIPPAARSERPKAR